MALNRVDSGFFVWLALSFCFGYNEAKRETNVLFILKKFGESMISYIKGTLERRGENDIIVEAGGIGYPIFFFPCHIGEAAADGRSSADFYIFQREGGWYEPVRLCGERGAGDV